MRKRSLISLAFGLLVCLTAAGKEVPWLKTAREVYEFTSRGTNHFARFSLSGVLIRTQPRVIFQDASGRIPLVVDHGPYVRAPALAPGDTIKATGPAVPSESGDPWCAPSKITVIRHGEAPRPTAIPLDELDERKHDLLPVVTEGTVVRIIPDGLDANYLFLLLKRGDCLLPVAVIRDGCAPERWLDAVVRVSGIYHRSISGTRKFSGPFILADDDGLAVVTPPPEDPFDAPALKQYRRLSPNEIARLGRQSVRGEVLATWGGNRMMVREADGRIVNVTLADGQPLPASGVCGVAVGYAETDLLRINLAYARFKPLGGLSAAANETPQDVEADKLFWDAAQSAIEDKLHGTLVRTRGIVRTTASAAGGDGFFTLESQNRRMTVDISSNREIANLFEFGCEIEVTARYRFETDSWRPDNIFPKISGFALVPRSPADIRVLSRPSWWTPVRLLYVIGALFLALAVVFVWNRLLQRLVERKSRELLKSNLKSVRSELRVDERTRLAVELHDSVSQNISGASMRVEAARRLMTANPAKATGCLAVAAKTLASCREELRNCIWDLRSRALEEHDMNEAIRKTIQPLLAKARLSIRFNVSRQRFSENTAHAILCIVRELVANAVRHGQAENVAVAGTLDGELVRFSVTDDGCGFDPARRPGIAEGHFGLEGIAERCRRLGGGMTVKSERTKGTRIAIWIRSSS